jgi:hypothetical protein
MGSGIIHADVAMSHKKTVAAPAALCTKKELSI